MEGGRVDKHEAANAAEPVCVDDSLTSRRAFLATSVAALAATWIAADWPGIAAAGEYAEQAQQTARSGRPVALAVFSDAQAVELDAVVSKIIPTDETPGAHEAGIVYFIDRSVATFLSSSRAIYMQGFDELQAKAEQMFPGSNRFSALNATQQIQLLTAIETTPFFKMVRDHTVIGMFASPQHGGNHREAGWKLIGFENTLNFTPPFGYYDAAP
jgi:gluconate 2-dehydrogenase gamma chain